MEDINLKVTDDKGNDSSLTGVGVVLPEGSFALTPKTPQRRCHDYRANKLDGPTVTTIK